MGFLIVFLHVTAVVVDVVVAVVIVAAAAADVAAVVLQNGFAVCQIKQVEKVNIAPTTLVTGSALPSIGLLYFSICTQNVAYVSYWSP